MAVFDSDSWQEIWATMRANKLRTILTAWGVFWGIFMLVGALGFGAGLRRGVSKQMLGSAANSIYVWGQRTTIAYEGFKPGRRISFTNDDLGAVRTLDGIEHLAPRLQLGGFRDGTPVSRGQQSGAYEIMGDYPAIQYVQPMFISGRFINDIDIEDRRKIAIIGREVYRALFEPGEQAIGELIKIRGVAFEVVGIFDSRADGDQKDRREQTIFVPFTSFQQSFNTPNRVNWFALTADPSLDPSDLEERFRGLLATRHHAHPNDKRAIGSFNVGKEFAEVQQLFDGVKLLLWLVGIATLFAGALGVSNIMLISVKERTKEIGIRKALGARPRQIVTLVMSESVTLTAIAGYIGLFAAIGLLEFASRIVGDDGMLANPQVDIHVAISATIILIISGAIAGIIPAYHAANVSPIESLRAE